MLTKHGLTQVLSSDFKKTPVYFSWNFLIYWSAIHHRPHYTSGGCVRPLLVRHY